MLLPSKKGPLCHCCPLLARGIAVSDRVPPEHGWSGLSIVGEMPGRNEVQQHEVFVGQSGQHLDKIRKWRQLPDAHVTNAVRCGLPRGMKPSIGDTQEAAKCCKALNIENMRYLGTKCSLHLGALSMHAYMGIGNFDPKQGWSGIETYRGSVLPAGAYETWPATCTLHPAGIIREESAFIKVEYLAADLAKAHALACGEVVPWDPDVRDSKDAKVLCQWLIDVRKQARQENAVVTLDVETWGATAKESKDQMLCTLRTIGISFNGVAYSIPHHGFYRYYTQAEWDRIYKLLRSILIHQGINKLFHNKFFDVPILEKWFRCQIGGIRHDSMQAHQVCFPRLRHDLQNVAAHFLPVHPWKSDFKLVGRKKVPIWTSPEETWEEFLELMYYNACDCLGTEGAFKHLNTKMSELGVRKAYDLDLNIIDMAIDWYRTGICIDRNLLKRLERTERQELRTDLKALQKIVEADVEDPALIGTTGFVGADATDLQKRRSFNPRSPLQLRSYLFDCLGLIPMRYTAKTELPSVAKEALWEMRSQTPYLEKHFAWKKRDHDYSLYLRGLPAKLHPDGRLRPAWKKQVIPSGRFSSSPNVQNYTKAMLEILIAPKGYVVIGADYDQLEIRVAAALAAEWSLIEILLKKVEDKLDPTQDVHARNGYMYYREVWDRLLAEGDLAAIENLRTRGKPITFLMQYMGSDNACYEAMKEWRPDDAEVDLRREASLCRARWINGHPAIVYAADTYLRMANKYHHLRTFLLGRVLRWPMGNASPTDASNFPIQGGARDLMDLGLDRWRRDMESRGVYGNIVQPFLDVHDAVFAICKKEAAEEEAQKMQECLACELEITSPVTGEQVFMKFPAEAKIGANVKEVK